MGIVARLKVGAVLTKDGLLLIRNHPRLALFPVVSGVVGLVFLGLFFGVTFGLARVGPNGVVLFVLFVAYLFLTFVSSFFTAGLVHQTRAAVTGGKFSLRDGLAAAWDRKGPLFVWSLIAATVGVLLNAIEGSDSRIGRLFALVSVGTAALGIGVLLFGFATAFIVSQTLQGVVKTSLYLYAETGLEPDEFDNVDFENLNETRDRGFESPRRSTSGGFH